MGFTRRARRLILLLPQIALAATAGTAAALLARGLSARGKQRRAASIDSGSSACDVEFTVLDVDPGACKAPAAACDLGGSSSTLIGWALQQVGLTPSALSTRQIIGRLKSIWITLPASAAAALEVGEEKRVVDSETLEAICGEWAKDFKRCEPMDEFFSLFGVNRVLRRAARLMRGMRIELRDDRLSVTQLCALRWFSVTEDFPLAEGASGEQRRRDLRRGAQRGVLSRAADGVVRLEVSWGPPLEGCAVDEMRLVPTGRRRRQQQRGQRGGGGGSNSSGGASGSSSSGGVGGGGHRAAVGADDFELHIVSTAWVGGRKARFKWVCVKKE